MRASILTTALLCAAVSGAASAAPYHALLGKLVPNGCINGVCGYLSIDKASAAGTSPKGALFKLDVKYWYDDKGKTTNNSSETVYVFCSTTVPAYLYDDGSAWQAVVLAPGNQEQISEANRQALVTYWAGCHATAVKEPYDEAPGLAQQFGYDPAAQSEDKVIANPSDALKW